MATSAFLGNALHSQGTPLGWVGSDSTGSADSQGPSERTLAPGGDEGCPGQSSGPHLPHLDPSQLRLFNLFFPRKCQLETLNFTRSLNFYGLVHVLNQLDGVH